MKATSYSCSPLAKCSLLVWILVAQHAFADATTYQVNAGAALDQLMRWYNEPSGLWSTTGWWNGANCLQAVADLASFDPRVKAIQFNVWDNTFTKAQLYNPDMVKIKADNPKEIAKTYYAKSNFQSVQSRKANRGLTKRGSANFLNDYYDDEGWWGLAWVRVYDVTGDQKYLTEAATIFNDMAASWPSKCNNGGIWWDRARTYTNAIANELFIQLAAALANRVSVDQKAGYLTWAQEGWKWFKASGMINGDNNINDGLGDDCKNNQGTVWSYNQGVILGGLVELSHATGNTSYLDEATHIADAAIAKLSDGNGILHDVCEPNCGADGTQFKGVFMRNLRMLQLARPQMRWYNYMRSNAQSIWENDLVDVDGGLQLGVNWAGPMQGSPNASTQSSALDALTAAFATR